MDSTDIRKALQDISSGDQKLLEEIEAVHRLIRAKNESIAHLQNVITTAPSPSPSQQQQPTGPTEAEYRQDIEALGNKLATARAECQRKDAIIQELSEALSKARQQQQQRTASVSLPRTVTTSHEAIIQTEGGGGASTSTPSSYELFAPKLQHVVAQIFDVVTGEPSDRVPLYSNEQCVDAISTRVEAIVKKIERLMNFRQEVTEFLKKIMGNQFYQQDDDVYSQWRKGRAKVLELMEANAALQAEVEEHHARSEPPRPSGWTREVIAAYQNVRNAFVLSVRHTQWHKDNTRRGEDPEYHDMCELTRRVEEVQGRLHWVVANCLDDRERGSQLEPPILRDDVIGQMRSHRVVQATAAPRVVSPGPATRRGVSPSPGTNTNQRPRSPIRSPMKPASSGNTPLPKSPRASHPSATTSRFMGTTSTHQRDVMKEFFNIKEDMAGRYQSGGYHGKRSVSPSNVSMGGGGGGRRSTSTSPARVQVVPVSHVYNISNQRWR